MKFEPAKRMNKIPKSFFSVLDDKIAETRSELPLIDLSKGNPDLPTPKNIVSTLQKAAESTANDRYSPFDGKEDLKRAISVFYKREYGVQIDPESEVAIFSGAAIGLFAFPQVILNPGDYAIITDPHYPEYVPAIKLANGKIFECPLTKKNRFLPDFSGIPEDVLNKSKLLLLNYPNNPTGAVANRKFFTQTIRFANEHNLVVINDFAYASLGYEEKPVSLLQIPGAVQSAVEIYTLSKTYSMAGWRIGFAVGNKDIIASLKQYHAHAYSTVYGAVQDAAVEALTGSQKGANDILASYRKRRKLFVDGLNKLGYQVEAPKGTFFVWVSAPSGFDGERFANYLFDNASIAVAPGIGFGNEGKNYVRISLVQSEKVLETALKRINHLREVELDVTRSID